MNDINLEVLPKDGNRVLEELENGNMVVARSKNDFIYILDFDGQFHMFRHTPGAPGGGQKKFPKDEKHIATVRKIADISDSVYMADYNDDLNIFGVMATVEDAVLSMFPGEDRDADGSVDFSLPKTD